MDYFSNIFKTSDFLQAQESRYRAELEIRRQQQGMPASYGLQGRSGQEQQQDPAYYYDPATMSHKPLWAESQLREQKKYKFNIISKKGKKPKTIREELQDETDEWLEGV